MAGDAALAGAASAIEPEDERRHEPSADPRWVEAWSLDLVQADLRLGASFELLFSGFERVAAFHASVVRADAELVTLSEIQAEIPAAPGLELRASGLWAEVGIQTPLQHVTVDLEAFAVQLAEPDEVFGRAYGTRVAFGCELEWETAGPVEVGPTQSSYEIPCVVHGEILVAHEVLEIDGWGWRSHRWGTAQPGDRSALRGRLADSSWWRVPGAVPSDLQTVARSPIACQLAGHPGQVEQRLVRNARGDAGWARSIPD